MRVGVLFLRGLRSLFFWPARHVGDTTCEVLMSIPEKDARTKACPLLPTVDGTPVSCLGDRCMMWCFKYPERHSESDPGYCGLAGKPAGAM